MLEQTVRSDKGRDSEENDLTPSGHSTRGFRVNPPFRTIIRQNSFLPIRTWTSNRAKPITQRNTADAGLEKSS